MRLLATLVAVLAAIGCAEAGAPPPASGASDVALALDLAHPGSQVPASFIGFGFEFDDVLRFTGPTPNGSNPVFLRLLDNVRSQGAGSLSWRIGGNSTDDSWWNPGGLARPPGIGYDLTPTWLASVSGAAAGSGVQVVMGVNLVLDDPAAAADWAQAVRTAFGDRVPAFEIGNEPNAYGFRQEGSLPDGQPRFARTRDYSMAQYAADYASYAAALRARLGPAARLAGPAVLDRPWMQPLPDFLAAAAGTVDMVTYHQYPLSVCGRRPGEPGYPTIAQLLSEQASRGLAAEVAPFVAQSAASRLPLRVDEMNSVVCFGAPGVSDTFAAALWLTDVLFEYAAVGVSGVNVQTNTRASYSPFVFGPRGGVSVRPDYYGMLLAARALRPGARLVPVTGRRVPPGVKGWATRDADGTLRVVLVNKSGSSVRVMLGAPGRSAALARLTAPGPEATSGVRLGGETFDGTSTGAPSGESRSERLAAANGFRLDLPAASAAILTIDS